MKEKITIEGRSMIFNIVFIALNLTGLVFFVMGYHDSAENNSTLFKSIGWILMMLSVGGIIVFKGRLMMSNVSRVLVGGLFIVSGLVKANDPIGFSYKLEEYFEDGALAYRIKEMFGAPGFSMEGLIEWALFLSVLVCIAEIVLGVLIIIGGKVKIVSYLMMFMMIFFTFLTWHTSTCDHEVKFLDHDSYDLSDPADASLAKMKLKDASAAYNAERAYKKDKTKGKEPFVKEIWMVSKSKDEVVIAEMKGPQCVTDCGCFGDAMKGSVGRSLTPKESLWKDIILLYLVLWIFLAQWIIKPNNRKQNLIFSGASMLVVVFFSWVFGWYFPIFFALASIVGALWILRIGGKYLGNYYGSALGVTVLCIFMVTYVLMYNPIKDYRPYSVGSDLNEKMNDGVVGEYENVLVYKNKKNGKEREYNGSSDAYIKSKIWEDTLVWEYKEMRQRVIVESVNASIMDFHPMIDVKDLSKAEMSLGMIKTFMDTSMTQVMNIRDHYDDQIWPVTFEEYLPDDYPVTDYTIVDTVGSYPDDLIDIDVMDAILLEKRIVMVVSKSLEEGTWSNMDKLKALQAECKKKKVPFILICNASRESINAFRKKNKFNAAVFSMDEIELKIISRSNPSIVVLEKGVVKGKYPYRSIPSAESFRTKHLK